MKKYFLITGLVAAAFCSVVSAKANDAIYTDELGRMHFLGKGGYSSVRKIQMDEVQAGVVNDAVNKYSAPQAEERQSETRNEVPASTEEQPVKTIVPQSNTETQPAGLNTQPVFKPLDNAKNLPSEDIQQGNTPVTAGESSVIQPAAEVQPASRPQQEVKPVQMEEPAPALREVIKEQPTVNKAKHKSSFTFKKGTMDPSNPYSYGSTNIPDKSRYEKDKEEFEAQKAKYFGTSGNSNELNQGPRNVNPAITPDRRF